MRKILVISVEHVTKEAYDLIRRKNYWDINLDAKNNMDDNAKIVLVTTRSRKM